MGQDLAYHHLQWTTMTLRNWLIPVMSGSGERTGVVRRHIIKEETTVSMAAEAGRQALENAGIAAEDVDLIIVSTISSNVILPCTACEVQKDSRAKHATCFDLSAACTGLWLLIIRQRLI